MARLTEKQLNGLWTVLAAVILVAGIGGIVLFAADWLSNGRVEQRAEELAKEKMAAMAQQPQGAPPAAVRVTPVIQELLQQRVSVVGRLREVQRATVASEVEGRVLEVLVDIGDHVTRDKTVIARVDEVWAQLQVEQARADLSAATARSNQTARDLKHQESLSQRGASDPQALDEARSLAEAEAANVEAYTAALHRAEETARRLEIVAPFDGTVTSKHTEVGQWLEPGGAVVEIVSRGAIDAVIDVPEQYISSLSNDQPIDVVIGPLKLTVTGKVVAINPDGSNAARTYPVKIRIEDPDGLLKVGMSVTARVPIRGEAEYLIVPRDAVAFSDGGAQIWMSMTMPSVGGSDPGGGDQSGPPPMPMAMPMDIEVLFGDGERFAIRPLPKMKGMGLSAGIDVVIEGKESLWPTRPLIIVPSGPPMDEAAAQGVTPGTAPVPNTPDETKEVSSASPPTPDAE